MYDTEVLNEIIDDYLNVCRGRPSKKGLAQALGASTTTIYNVIHGAYHGIPYCKEPGPRRLIDNCDFEIVRSVFD